MTSVEHNLQTPELAPARPVLDQDWRRIARFGAIGALALIFISLTDMPDKLDGRMIVEPLLSMGYFSLLWVPFLFGNLVTREVVLEGMVAHRKGVRELLAGALVGLLSSLGLVVLIYLLDTRDLSEPLVNWNSDLHTVLTFGEGNGYGMGFWIAVCVGLGLLGGLFHLLPRLVVQPLKAASIVVLGAVVLESALNDLSEGFGLESLFESLFKKGSDRGGLSVTGALVLAAFGFAWVFVLNAQVAKGKQVFQQAKERNRSATMTVSSVVGVALVLILPMYLGRLTNDLLVNVGLFLLLALGLNIVVGLAGILDLGYVAFFAVGGYTAAILTSPSSPGFSPELSWSVAIIAVVGMAILAGLFIGAPVIRMRGDYLAIVTLGFGEIIRLTVRSDWASGVTGGAQGILNIPNADVFGLFSFKGTDPQQMLYLVAAFCALAIYVSWRLENSRIGRAWMAVREDESVAEAMGINTVNAKLQAFVVGAILASFSGAIFAAKVGSVFEISFKILISIVILVVVIVGGMGRIAGVIAGALVLIGILGGPNQPGLLSEFSEFKLLIYGALLVWMMLQRPEGLIPNVRRSRELHQDEFLQDAWLRKQVDEDEAGGEGEVAPA
jgi:branched-chain amino acid transport system permease protein